jgi:hypothetical protein
MIFVSYYTGNGNYPALAEQLGASLRKFNLPHAILKVKDHADWQAAADAKPQFIIHQLCRYRRPVVWLDVDTEIVQLPHLLYQTVHDFAVYNWHADAHNPLAFPYDPHRLTCSGGVIQFGYTAAAMELLLRWSDKTGKHGLHDDVALDAAFNDADRPPVHPLWLPRAYNRMTGMFKDNPVIDHHYTAGKHGIERQQGDTDERHAQAESGSGCVPA